MGLEIVELLRRVEEEFEIVIRDEEAEHTVNCGELCEVVLHKLRERGASPGETETWEKLRAVLADETSGPPERIARETRFLEDLGLG